MSDVMHMDRRGLLQSAFALVGASVALSACDFGGLGSKGTFTFDDKQRALVSAIADTFVPKTDTAGAVEAGVVGPLVEYMHLGRPAEVTDAVLADHREAQRGGQLVDAVADLRVDVIGPPGQHHDALFVRARPVALALWRVLCSVCCLLVR